NAPLGRTGFGASLALDGSHLVVGRWRDRHRRECVALLDAATGALRQIYRAPRRRSSFGATVAIRGKRVLIGAPSFGNESGRAYLFARDSGRRLATYRV